MPHFECVAQQGIRSLIPYQPGTSIETIQREKGISDVIKMASNENPLGCSPNALTALQKIASSQVATYPAPSHHRLMSALAHKLNIETDRLFLANGSDALFNLLLICFGLHTGKAIVTHQFAFSSYAIQAHALQIPVHQVEIDADLRVNMQKLIAACTDKVGLVFIANPNNPTGLLIPPAQIKQLLEQISPSILVVLDEAYYEYAATQLNCNTVSWLEAHSNLVITRTFSKIYGLAGLRLGYAIAHPEIIALLQRTQLPFAVNQAALEAAYAALDDDLFIQQSLQMNQEGMLQLSQGFQQLKLTYLPSSGNFLTINYQQDTATLYDFLLNHGIITRPLHAYKMPQYLRVTIGTKEQNQRLLKALADR